MSEFTESEFRVLWDAALSDCPALAGRADLRKDPAVRRLWRVCDRLIDNGRRFNLTSILDPAQILRKHVIDSILPLVLLGERGIAPRRVLDVGTGAGFPLMPWAALLPPETKLCGLDATGKKISHIRETAEYAELPNVEAVQGRAEEFARDAGREAFDCVTARAVAALPVLLELCAPLTEPGGVFAALKSHAEEELEASRRAAELLGLGEPETVGYSLPGGDARTLLLYRKIRPTPAKYPRRYAEIVKQPIV